LRREKFSGLPTRSFRFKTATVTRVNFWSLSLLAKPDIVLTEGQAEEYVEDLGNGIILRMVKVGGGKFLMGSPKNEAGRSSDESPQHEVTVPDFFMGMFTVTQAQWKAVAQFPKGKIELNSDPSHFKGENRPVESITWNEAIEFCDRLSTKTGRTYTLPSEAQWEYACRAGTQTAFAFGDMVTPELANYNWTTSYNGSPKRSSYPQETQPVGSYPANAWGLYDMHGNVWEWCLDDWHENYQGAPIDGSAWTDQNSSTTAKLLRGGSCYDYAWISRSANRYWRFNWDFDIGFRVLLSSRIP